MMNTATIHEPKPLTIPGLTIQQAVAGETAWSRYVITSLSMKGKTFLIHQLIEAYGHDQVLVGDCGRALDAILPWNPNLVSTKTREELMTVLRTLYRAPKPLPMWFVVDDFSAIGDNIESDSEKKSWPGEDDDARHIAKYKSVKLDLGGIIDALSMLPCHSVINATVEMHTFKKVSKPRIMLPGAAFLSALPRKVNNLFVLNCKAETDPDTGQVKVKRYIQTVEDDGFYAGCRSKALEPYEPANLPAIHEKLTGQKPIYEVVCQPDGLMRRVDS